MRRYIFFFFCLSLILGACQKKTYQTQDKLFVGQEFDFEKPLTTIAFGSCSRQDLDQVLWPIVNKNEPDLWIWLGDNIYGDTEDMDAMERMYLKQKNDQKYQELRAQSMVIGIWDDHDYGTNDGNKSYPKREESKHLLMDFLDVPKSAETRKRPGAYQSFTFGSAGKDVKIILLDIRYFQDVLQKNRGGGDARYLINEDGDILGEAQWQWLEEELKNSQSTMHIIGSGLQIIPKEHPFEKWANFPKSRQRLFDLFKKYQPKNLLLLSGDRHIAEISKIELEGLDQPVYEFTASGLTHSYEEAGDEKNAYRQSPLIGQKNFGIMRIDWSANSTKRILEIRGEGDRLFHRMEIK